MGEIDHSSRIWVTMTGRTEALLLYMWAHVHVMRVSNSRDLITNTSLSSIFWYWVLKLVHVKMGFSTNHWECCCIIHQSILYFKPKNLAPILFSFVEISYLVVPFPVCCLAALVNSDIIWQQKWAWGMKECLTTRDSDI